VVGLSTTIDTLGLISNLISCLILALVMRLLHKRTSSVELGRGEASEKSKINSFVTASHIGVTLAFSVTQILLLSKANKTRVNRMSTAFYFCGGAADLFLSLMLWFILDNQKTPTVLVEGNRVYAVVEVIKGRESLNSSKCDSDEETEAQPTNFLSECTSTVSKRMIEQFFTEVEGPDRDWHLDDLDIFEA
jgi:hypothetical protein